MVEVDKNGQGISSRYNSHGYLFRIGFSIARPGRSTVARSIRHNSNRRNVSKPMYIVELTSHLVLNNCDGKLTYF